MLRRLMVSHQPSVPPQHLSCFKGSNNKESLSNTHKSQSSRNSSTARTNCISKREICNWVCGFQNILAHLKKKKKMLE